MGSVLASTHCHQGQFATRGLSWGTPQWAGHLLSPYRVGRVGKSRPWRLREAAWLRPWTGSSAHCGLASCGTPPRSHDGIGHLWARPGRVSVIGIPTIGLQPGTTRSHVQVIAMCAWEAGHARSLGATS